MSFETQKRAWDRIVEEISLDRNTAENWRELKHVYGGNYECQEAR